MLRQQVVGESGVVRQVAVARTRVEDLPRGVVHRQQGVLLDAHSVRDVEQFDAGEDDALRRPVLDLRERESEALPGLDLASAEGEPKRPAERSRSQ
jgi:hypothetical protein